MIDHPKVLGVGEIGLDFFSYKSNGIVDPVLQEKIFRSQIELAIKHSLPIQIHNRHAGHEVVSILTEYTSQLQSPPGVFHCFAGDLEILEKVLALGFFVGFDGNSTYPGLAPGENTELKTLIAHTPIERIIIETDSPYLTPIPLRGTRNEPKNVIIVNEFVAGIKEISPQELAFATTKNFTTVFSV
jgi:TatD DNase family protein